MMAAGLGYGCFLAIDFALVMDVLPNRKACSVYHRTPCPHAQYYHILRLNASQSALEEYVHMAAACNNARRLFVHSCGSDSSPLQPRAMEAFPMPGVPQDAAKDLAVWHAALVLPQVLATPVGGLLLDSFQASHPFPGTT